MVHVSLKREAMKRDGDECTFSSDCSPKNPYTMFKSFWKYFKPFFALEQRRGELMNRTLEGK